MRPQLFRLPMLFTLVIMVNWQVIASRAVGATRATLDLTPRSSLTHGQATVVVRRLRSGLDGTLLVTVRNLDARTTYEIVIDGVRIGTLTTNAAGRGRARFRTQPLGHDQLLGVDPRGQPIAVHALTGTDELTGVVPQHIEHAG